jgi:hypothetical protein
VLQKEAEREREREREEDEVAHSSRRELSHISSRGGGVGCVLIDRAAQKLTIRGVAMKFPE